MGRDKKRDRGSGKKDRSGGKRGGGSAKSSKRGARGWQGVSEKKKRVPKATLEKVAVRLKTTLDRANKHSPLKGRARVHINKDGTVDAALSIALPRGKRAARLLQSLSDRVAPISPEGIPAWISVAARYTFKDEEELYRRYKGMPETAIYWQRTTKAKIGTQFLTARDIVNKTEKKRRTKAIYTIINLHWNPEGKKPKR